MEIVDSVTGEPCCSSTPNPADKQLCHGDPTSVRSQGLCSTRSRASDTAKTSGKYLGDRISAYTKPQDFSESHCDNDSNRMDKDDHYGQFNEQGRELSSAVSVRGSAGKVAGLLCILCLLRVLRRWNQTGNKWLDVPDVGDWLVRSDQCVFFFLLRCVCVHVYVYVCVCVCVYVHTHAHLPASVHVCVCLPLCVHMCVSNLF